MPTVSSLGKGGCTKFMTLTVLAGTPTVLPTWTSSVRDELLLGGDAHVGQRIMGLEAARQAQFRA